jgi:hypothetical protein
MEIADIERGKIRNLPAYCQHRDFSGLRLGKITPTDIDGTIIDGYIDESGSVIEGSIDFSSKLFVFLEGKYKDANISEGGQKWNYEAITRGLENEDRGQHAITIVFQHGAESPIIVDQCPVIRTFQYGKWIDWDGNLTVKQHYILFLYTFGQEWRLKLK